MHIQQVQGRQILDSRGRPTLECVMTLSDGKKIMASVPAGLSKGKYEAHELRDGDQQHFAGQGVLQAAKLLDTVIAETVVGLEPDGIIIDKLVGELDLSPNKAKLGANTTLAISMAVWRAQAHAERVELYQLINQVGQFPAPRLPSCMFNLINGGMHAENNLIIQEFLVVPEAGDYQLNLECADTIYQELREILVAGHYGSAIGDEGGFSPNIQTGSALRDLTALNLLQDAVSEAGFGRYHVGMGLDCAATHIYDPKTQAYQLGGEPKTTQEMIAWYQALVQAYGLTSLEDPLDEDDWQGWQALIKALPGVQIVGDDLLATSVERIKRAIELKAVTAVLIKPNQVGSITQTIQAIKLCQTAGLGVIISHRSGETNDTFIADLAVGSSAGQCKFGAPVRGERVAKYNRLLAIAELLAYP